MRKGETPSQEDNSEFNSLTVNPLTGQQMTMKLYGMKEYDRMMEELRKENFELKVRIYLLEDGRKENFECNSKEVQTQMEEMKKIIDDKEAEILGKEEILSERKSQMTRLMNRLEIEQARSETLEQNNFDISKQLSEKKRLISTLKHEISMYEKLEMKTNVAGISLLPHVDDDNPNPSDIYMLPLSGSDDSSLTETISSGSNVHPKTFKAEPHSKSNQDGQPFNEIVEYQTACSMPTSSHHQQLSLHNKRSCLGGDSISLSEPKRKNHVPELASSPSGFKYRLFQINSELQQLLEVKTKENVLLRAKLGLSDQVGEIDPTFLPDVNQLKKKVRHLKTELNKSSEMIRKQQISINVHCKEIERMRQERNACLCGISGGNEERISDSLDNKNFDNQHHQRKNQKEERSLKNETVQNGDDTTDSEQRVKYLTDKFINMNMIISQQSRELDWYKNIFEASVFPIKRPPSSTKNLTPNIYGEPKFTFDSETEPNFTFPKVPSAENSHRPKSEIAESKDRYQKDLEINNILQSELAIRKSEQQQQQQKQWVSTSLNKDCSSNHLADVSAGLSLMLAHQCPSSKMNNKTKSPNNNLLNTSGDLPSKLCQKIDPLESSGFNDGHKSEVVMLLKHYLTVNFNVCNQLSDYLVDIEGLLDTVVKEFRPKVMLKKKMNNVHAIVQRLQTLLQVDRSP